MINVISQNQIENLYFIDKTNYKNILNTNNKEEFLSLLLKCADIPQLAEGIARGAM